MSVKLRLMRLGRRNRPYYRVCAIDTRSPRDGAFIENLGTYDPYVEDDKKKAQIDKSRAEYWIGVGAQPSETVRSLLLTADVQGLFKAKKPRRRRPKKSSPKLAERRKARSQKKQAEKEQAAKKKEAREQAAKKPEAAAQ